MLSQVDMLSEMCYHGWAEGNQVTQSNLNSYLSYEAIHELHSGSKVEVLEFGATKAYRADPEGAHAGNDQIWIPTCTACQAVAQTRKTNVEELAQTKAPKEVSNG